MSFLKGLLSLKATEVVGKGGRKPTSTFLNPFALFSRSFSTIGLPKKTTRNTTIYPTNHTSYKFISNLAPSGSLLKNLPKSVKIVEVGARDGLQNEIVQIPTNDKVKFINMLTDTGLQSVEATAFVSPRWVPQMADSTEVMQRINKKKGVSYPVLVPNAKGLEKALEVGATEFAIFVSASETFSQKNINCSINESFLRYKEVTDAVNKHKLAHPEKDLKIRGYVSCVMGCPYEGDVDVNKVVEVSNRLYKELGCYEISLGDTIGVGNAGKTFSLITAHQNPQFSDIPTSALALHAHDTYGQALSNILMALQLGVNVVDSSVSGIGGCPYAKGASGNVATEEVVYMLDGMGIPTGVDLSKLIQVGNFISDVLGRPSQSRVATATLRKEVVLPPGYSRISVNKSN